MLYENFLKIFLKLLLFIFWLTIARGAKPSARTLTEFKGLESSFYSTESGKAYLSLKYESANMRNPKIGFLKFGMSFLEVNDLRARLDLRYARSSDLFSKWKNLLNQKAIRYATFEPIVIILTDRMGHTYLLKSSKGKLNASGRLMLFGGSTIEHDGLIESFPRLVIDFDDTTSRLIIEKDKLEKIKLLIQ